MYGDGGVVDVKFVNYGIFVFERRRRFGGRSIVFAKM